MTVVTPGSLLDYVLRLDAGTPCGKGWTGTKPGCKRAKKGSGVATASKPESMVAKPTKPAKSSGTGKKEKKSLDLLKSSIESGGDNPKATFSVTEGGTEKVNKDLRSRLLSWQEDGQKRWEKDRETYAANYGIIGSIFFSHAESPEKTRVLTDSKGNIQSAATVTEDRRSLRIEYLATAPWNVKGGEGKSVKGAGTKMIEEVIKESFKKGKSGVVTLEVLDSAISFYEKIGFRNMGKNDEGGVEMKLDSEAAKEFLKKRGAKQ
jgi:hypothetical protein